MYCKLRFGATPRNPSVAASVELLKKTPPDKSDNLYYHYCATQVMHHMGGDDWKNWNASPEGNGGLRDTLVKAMDTGATEGKAHQAGSWAPFKRGGFENGRLMATSLALLNLEMYYRHLRLHRHDAGDKEK